MTDNREQVLEDLHHRYKKRTAASKAAIEKARGVLPGGDTRSVLHFSPYPLVLASGNGCEITDLDGNRYLDFLCDYGAGLYGHSHPKLIGAMAEALKKGLTLGGVVEEEYEFARLLTERFPALERVRFTNSGSEANLMAITSARLFTGRDKLLVFKGGYHGCVLIYAEPASRICAPYDVVYGSFNDIEATRSAIAGCADQLAAIIVEPMIGAGGVIPAKQVFLQELRTIADSSGALLIFDEVLTSRIGSSGGQGYYQVFPDLMTCGKYLGGGGNFGAFGGRADIMAMYDAGKPDAVMHGGTFNNNVLTMVAGSTGLREVFTAEQAVALTQRADRFRQVLNKICRERGVAMQWTGLGPLLGVHFLSRKVLYPSQQALSSPILKDILHMALLERGIYMAPRGAVVLSVVHTESHFDAFKQALAGVLDSYQGVWGQAERKSELGPESECPLALKM